MMEFVNWDDYSQNMIVWKNEKRSKPLTKLYPQYLGDVRLGLPGPVEVNTNGYNYGEITPVRNKGYMEVWDEMGVPQNGCLSWKIPIEKG